LYKLRRSTMNRGNQAPNSLRQRTKHHEVKKNRGILTPGEWRDKWYYVLLCGTLRRSVIIGTGASRC